MAKRRLETYEDYDRALQQGFGLGELRSYKPWIRVQDVPSHGQSSKIPGIKIDRPHHLLSNNEKNMFFFIEREKTVVDIREQFPLLPLDLTIRIANELGIKHPVTRKGRVPAVRTIDFLLTLEDRDTKLYRAITVKEAVELTHPRTLELLELERAACHAIGIPLRLVTDKQINKVITANLDWVSEPLRGRVKKKEIEVARQPELLEAALDAIFPGVTTLSLLAETLARQLSVGESIAIDALKILIWGGQLDVDLSESIERTGTVRVLSKPRRIERINYGIAG